MTKGEILFCVIYYSIMLPVGIWYFIYASRKPTSNYWKKQFDKINKKDSI